MRVNLRGRNVGMSQHRLHRTEISSPLQQVGRERMAQHMRRGNLGDSSPLTAGAQEFPEPLPRERRAPTRDKNKP